MGNCVASHESEKLSAHFIGCDEFIMVRGSDGKITQYTAPLLLRDLTAAFPQHSVVHSEDETCRPFSPDQELVPGQLYQLLIVPNSPSLSKDAVLSRAKNIDNGKFEDIISSEGSASTWAPSSVKSVQNGNGVVRVKMVISKRELRALLSDRSMIDKSLLLQRQSKAEYVKEDYVARRRGINVGWRPSIETIPEVD